LATAIAEADAEVAAGGATRRSQQEALAEIERGPSRPGRRSRPTGGHRADTYRRA